MEPYSLGYRTLTFWGQPPNLNSTLKRITSKATNKAKVMMAREKSAKMAGELKSLDGVHVCMRRERVGKYASSRNLIAQSPVSIIRHKRAVNGKPKEAGNATSIKTSMFKGEPKAISIPKQRKEYVFRFGEVAYKTAI